jgi:hypothetical protein
VGEEEASRFLPPFPLASAAAISAARDVGVFPPQVVQMYLLLSRIHSHSEQQVNSSSSAMPMSLSVWT